MTEEPTVVIDGERIEDSDQSGNKQGRPRERFLVRINDLPVPLRGGSFRLLAILALARRIRDGWVTADRLMPQPEMVGRRLYDMKREIRYILRDSGDGGYALRCWAVVEKQRISQYDWIYRLCTAADQVFVSNPKALADFGHHDLLGLLTEREYAATRLKTESTGGLERQTL